MKKEVKLLTVKEYAATRKGWRGMPVSASHIYMLIKLYLEKKKTKEEIGFIPHADGKGWKIEPLKTKKQNETPAN